MNTAFICPFSLDRLTGTPIRSKTTIKAVAEFSKVSVITSSSSDFNPNVTLHIIKTGKLGNFILTVWQELKKIKPDIIHCVTTVAIIPALLYKYTGHGKTKIIFEMHGWTWFETKGKLFLPKRLVFLLIDIIGFWLANQIIAMSHTQKKFLLKFNPRKKIAVIWGPVDFPIVFQNPTNRPTLQVGYLGNSSWWQGLPAIIQTAELLEKQNLPITFALAGFDFSNVENFPRYENITYFGKIDRQGVPDFIKSCDIMLSCRVVEKVSELQFPHKLGEYLSSGRPVIGSNTNDQPQILLDGKCGFIIDSISPDILIQKLTEFTKMSFEERLQMGQQASLYAQDHFSFEVLVPKLENLYKLL